MAHKKLTSVERLEIDILLTNGHSLRSIARVLGRSPNTLSYEMKNRVRDKYDGKKAHIKAIAKRKLGRRGWKKIEQNPILKKLVISGLKNHWNPDEIAGRFKLVKGLYVSKTAIYQWLRTSRGERYCKYLYSQRTYVKKQKHTTVKVMIPNRVSITARKKEVNQRVEPGHWERDTVVSRKGCAGGVSTSIERTSRLFIATKVSSMRPQEHASVVRSDATKYLTLSVTYDNGIENRAHESTGIPSFFCDPYSSWQKGSDENGNKMFRRYYPKGTDFYETTQRKINGVVKIINNKPRKILGYRSALEVATELGIIKSESVLMRG